MIYYTNGGDMPSRLDSGMINNKERKIPLSFLLFCFVLFVLLLSDAGSDLLSERLGGEAFSDPSEIQEMDDDWQKKGIVYNTADGDADLVISLDQQMFPALKPLINKYAEEHNLKVVIKEGTCGITAGMLSRKAVDIGGYCCPPDKTDRLPGLRFHTIGIASIALIVHPYNPVEDITLNEARHVFMGDIHRWSELIPEESGDRYAFPIQVIGRLHCKLRPGHWRLLLDNEDLFSAELQEVGAIPDMISQVSSIKGSIGYETVWMIRRFSERGKVKVLNLDGHAPDDASALIAGDYPLYRVFSITTWEGESTGNPHARKLVDYILSSVEHLDSRYNLIPASRLREAGWRFKGDELVGEPEERKKR
jgi:ABC-type phosphate transport system substrate-binding protein